MNFQDFDIQRLTLPPLARKLAHNVSLLLEEAPVDLSLPLPLVHDLAMTMTLDLLEASEVSSPEFHGMTEEIPLLVSDLGNRSAVANRMLYLSQIATTALCLAIAMRKA